eukprot:s227_g14.t1
MLRRASFAWHAWHLATSAFVLCGRRGAWRHLPLFCVAGMALAALGWSPVAPRLFCVAGVARGNICLRFVWQAWHLATSAFRLCGKRGTYGTGLALVTPLVALGRLWRQVLLLGRRGTYGTGLALVTPLVALGRLLRRASFAWQAWHLATSAFVLRLPSFCVAGVALGALGDIYLGFVWQAWHLRHWVGSGDALGRAWSPVAPRLFCASARHLWQPSGSAPLIEARQCPLRSGARGSGPAVRQCPLRSGAGEEAEEEEEAREKETEAGDGQLSFLTREYWLTRGLRGTYATVVLAYADPYDRPGLAMPALAVRLGPERRRVTWALRHFAWQARHLETVAVMALADMDLHFLWQAWH